MWKLSTNTSGKISIFVAIDFYLIHNIKYKLCVFYKIEFGTINSDGNPYYGCSTLGSCTLSISPHCIYKGCTYPYPLTDDVVIDLFSIQQEIFAVMKKDVIRKDIIRKVVIRKDVIRKDVMKKNVMKKGVMKKRFIKKK